MSHWLPGERTPVDFANQLVGWINTVVEARKKASNLPHKTSVLFAANKATDLGQLDLALALRMVAGGYIADDAAARAEINQPSYTVRKQPRPMDGGNKDYDAPAPWLYAESLS